MPDMRSGPSPSTYRMPSLRSGTPPCSPNSLHLVSKAISTLGLQTCSPVTVNMWPFMGFSYPLFLSRLEFRKSVFWALSFSGFHQWTLWKILFISLPMTPPSAVPSVIPQISKQQPLNNVDLDKITSWSTTWNMSFNPDKFCNLTMSLQKGCLENP